MRLAVTGQGGQVATALIKLNSAALTVIPVARPAFDMAQPATILPALRAARPDVIVNAAAFTAVDLAQAEQTEAFIVNATGAGAVAQAASALGVPVIHLSTDYVFDGASRAPYVETDATGPQSIYGETKLEGERRVVAATPDHAILRLAWVYSATGRNFMRTMLRLGATRAEVGVVADQMGNPTAADDIARAIVQVATNLLVRRGDPLARGLFHMTASGEASWAEFAEAIFAGAALRGSAPVRVNRITTAEYPTPAARPANSRLNCAKIAKVHDVVLPPWRASLDLCLTELLGAPRQ
jgi:dTDP-4-dehydrorhamnose reductase